jgi:GntR family L-lactate dehydrogenase operon transcriptional regulator
MAMVANQGMRSDGRTVIKPNWASADNQLEFEILTEIDQADGPVGASVLSSKVKSSQATIGRKLNELECRRLLLKLSNKGRILTEEGRQYYIKLKKDLTSAETIRQLLDEANRSAPKRLFDTLAVRRMLEKEIVVLATRNITEREFKELETVIENQSRKVAQGFLGDEEDLLFHRSLAAFSRNEVLEQIITLILTQNRAYSGFSYIRKNMPSSVVTDHKRILRAIGEGDEVRAGELMVKHIDNIVADVNRYFRCQEKNS